MKRLNPLHSLWLASFLELGRLGPLSGKRKSERRCISYRCFSGYATTVKRKKTGSRETLAGRSGLTSFTPPHFPDGKTEAERVPVRLPGELVADLGLVSGFSRPELCLRMLPDFALGTFLLSLAS